jgi:hypothetical protein
MNHALMPATVRYPMLRAGGAFLLFIGLGLIGAIAFSGSALVNYNVFYAGAAAGVAALFFARRLSTGRRTRIQIFALAGAILLEVLLLILMGRTLPPGTEEHVRWLWVSAIVGVHFIPMSLCFGPRFLVLGVACIANAGLGLLAAGIPYEVFGLVDGILKLSFGVWSLWSRGGAA